MQTSKTTHIYLFKFSIALTEAVALASDDRKNGCIGGGCKWYRFGLYRRIFLPTAGVKIQEWEIVETTHILSCWPELEP